MSAGARWTVLDLLRWTTRHFQARGLEAPRLDAECLLAHALGSDRLRLYLDYDKPVEAAERDRFRALVRARADERRPVSQLLGRREFWSLPLRVSEEVLTPRPETETLVEAALALLPDPEAEARVLDLGTGSGAVALALASERPKARVTATDCSEAALALARENSDALGLAGRLRLLRGDLFEPVAGERFDLVVSNPPYLAEEEAEALPPELRFEPREALFAPQRGRGLLARIAAGAPAALAPGGAVAVELAPEQAGDVTQWLREAGLEEPSLRRDLAGRARVAVARRAPAAGASQGGE